MQIGDSGEAMFVDYPFTIEDLRKPHPKRNVKPFQVVGIIEIGKTDYENFLCDMTQWREWLQPYKGKTKITGNGVYRSVFVRRKDAGDGVLVVCGADKDGDPFPLWCAYLPE